jgi:hypothetical protein
MIRHHETLPEPRPRAPYMHRSTRQLRLRGIPCIDPRGSGKGKARHAARWFGLSAPTETRCAVSTYGDLRDSAT